MNELIDKIKTQFNSDERIEAMLQSYGVKPRDGSVEIDYFEPLREQLFFDLICQHCKPKSSVLDVGCGFGGLVLRLLKAGYLATGADLSENLIEIGKQLLHKSGYSPEQLLVADILQHNFNSQYNLITACGVIWYYADKRPFLKKIHALLSKGGMVIITHRNDLFNLYALNAGTIEFFTRHFTEHMTDDQKSFLLDYLNKNLPELVEPTQKHLSSKLNKDYENQFDIQPLYEECGFAVQKVCYAYIHPGLPRAGMRFSEEEYEFVHNKYAKNWQGMFMGSQFVVVARKI